MDESELPVRKASTLSQISDQERPAVRTGGESGDQRSKALDGRPDAGPFSEHLGERRPDYAPDTRRRG